MRDLIYYTQQWTNQR